MPTWLTPPTTNMPEELANATGLSRRRTRINRYRSRTDVTEDMISTAFAWMRLPKLADNELTAPNANYMQYITRSVQRGISVEDAKDNAARIISDAVNNGYATTVLTFNTATAATPAEAIKTMLDEASDLYTELNVRTMLVSSPNHKIHIYKRTNEERTLYVILNNIDSPAVVFKIAAAIMYEQNFFGEDTQKFAQTWLSGNPTEIFALIANHYKAYNDTKKEREFNAALSGLITSVDEAKKSTYNRKIRDIQDEIDNYYATIEDRIKTLNKIKGEYLLQLTTNTDERINDLKNYLSTCRDKISYIAVDGHYLTIIYRTELMYFEENLLQPYFNSNRDNIVNNAPDWMQQLLKDLFINKTYTLQIESGIYLDLHAKTFRYINPTSYIEYNCLCGIPNPHHKYYNCWGDNTPIIHKAMLESDYLTAILTAFAAMSGLSLSDTAVLDKFINNEFYEFDNTLCIKINETDEVITPEEYRRRFNNASNETVEQTDTGTNN